MPERPDPSRRIHLPAAATLDGYDRWAAAYDAGDNPLVRATAWALQREPLEVAGRRVVELGCGTGRHAPLAFARGATTFTGVDGSAGMLAIAARTPAAGRASWLHADLGATGLPTGQFDAILIVLVLEHLRELGPLCREAARLAAPHANLRLLEIHPDLVAAGTNAHFVTEGVEHRFTSFAHPVDALAETLTAAGFAVTSCQEFAATDALLAAVPRLAKHAGRRVLVDLTAVT